MRTFVRESWTSADLYLRQIHYYVNSQKSHSGATPSDTHHPISSDTCSSCTSLEVCPFKFKQTKRPMKKREGIFIAKLCGNNY